MPQQTALHLLPNVLEDTLLNASEIFAALTLLELIVEKTIESQTYYFEKKQYDLFNPHCSESCCAIQIMNTLLQTIPIEKTVIELEHFIAYLQRLRTRLQKQKNKTVGKITLIDFLKQRELILLLNPIDQYLLVSYFLTTQDHTQFTLTRYYETLIKKIMEAVISQLSADIIRYKTSQQSLQLIKKQLIKANRTKTEFLENMRHDIRTPLSGIIGFAELIQREAKNSRVAEYADHLMRATTALLHFQNNILDGIKLIGSENSVINTVFSVRELATRAMDLIKPKIIIKKLELRCEIDTAIPDFLIGDSQRLFRIFLELLTNATKFTQAGFVQFSLRVEKIYQDEIVLRCTVQDTGMGIPADKKEEIFARFFRITPASEGVHEGSGLGLTVIKKLIKDLGGKIKVDSMLAVGSTFTCFIPLKIAAAKNIAPITTPHETLLVPNPHILIVEDYAMTATVTQLLLQEIGCDVDIAENASMALQKLHHTKYNLILMDLGLPDYDGFLLSEKIHAHDPSAVIIALTAHKEQDAEKQAKAAGIRAIFQKPLLKSTVVSLLNTYLMKKPIIDLVEGAKRIGKDKNASREMIDLLRQSLSNDQKEIKRALQKKDFKKLCELNHKILGGLRYCGALQLEEASQHLQQVLQLGNTQSIVQAAEHVLSEIKQIQLVDPMSIDESLC